jgi:O-antigen biosynthesis protein
LFVVSGKIDISHCLKMFKEIKRLLQLSIRALRMFGWRFLIKEIVRYLLHGPAVDNNLSTNKINYLKTYSSEQIKTLLDSFVVSPKISIVTPVYNVAPSYLNECIQSVIDQYYTNWELCLYDDCSTNNTETKSCLENWIDKDARIKVQFGKTNKHISEASNIAIAMSTGDYIGLLDHDDRLAPEALLEVVSAINNHPLAELIYSDEDLINPEGEYCNPHFKPDFNLSLLLSHNYITHFTVIKKDTGDKVGWFRKGLEGAQDHDLLLRVIEKTSQIIHIPQILYHWRQTETSTALNYNEKSYADKASQKALSDYAQRNGIEAKILNGPGSGAYRFKRKITTNKKVSIVIPFKDQVNLLKECVTSILKKTNYENYEIILVSNNSSKSETKKYLDSVSRNNKKIRVLEYNNPFNYSAINNWAVKQASGEFILLLNNDIKAINEEWLESMLEHIQQDNVGIVGAKLLYADNTIQHAGVIIGIAGIAGHSHRFFPDSTNGYYYRPSVIQNLSAVTGACLLTKKKLWEEVKGLDETNFEIAFNDIDYCLKIRKLGYDIVYTPYAKLYHYESKSRGPEDTPLKRERFNKECKRLIEKWGTNCFIDPFYNINLTLDYENFNLKKHISPDNQTDSNTFNQDQQYNHTRFDQHI